MTAISDGVVIGIVLGLVFAAVSYYLFSRQTQLERKVSLMENILLDLKVTTEQTLLSSTEPPEHNDLSDQEGPEAGILDNSNDMMNNYREMNSSTNQQDNDNDNKDENNSETREVNVDQTTPRPRNMTPTIQVEKEKSSASSNYSSNYEAMTYKELVGVARQKGISGLRNMSKAQVIEALRGNISGGATTLSSWSLNDNEVTPIHELGSAMEANQGEVIASLELEPESSLVNSE
jgi:hypothetical protein